MNVKLVLNRVFIPCITWIPCLALASTQGFATLNRDPSVVYADLATNGLQLPRDGGSQTCATADLRGRPLTLVGAIDYTICRNPQLRAAWAVVRQQVNALGEARAAYLPTASLNVGRTRTDSNTGGLQSKVTGNTAYAAVNWQIYDFGARAAQELAAVNLLQAALANNDAALQKTLADTVQAYFDAQSARAALQSKQLGVATATATLESARRREEKGIVARGDRLQATTALARANLEKNRAHGNYGKQIAVLIYLMGLPAGSEVTLAEESDDGESTLGAQLQNIEQWLHSAEQSHPSIRGARAEFAAAQSKVAAVRSENKPTITLSGNVYKNGYPGQGVSATATQVRTIGLVLNVPLFDGFAHTYKVKEAEAQAEQKQQVLADTENRTLMEVVKVYAEASSALRDLQASLDLLHAAEESMESIQHKYAHDASDIVEILAAQAALADAREQRIISLFQWRSTRLRLIATSGTLGYAQLVEGPVQVTAP
ncbi:TolC family protein [Rugamonas sp. FT82W]|uniref:Protein CyaE n=1 Tax=Duganella vulcania TaxID=2692166 RepID=A0A845FUX3_9BURK|nr:TolC family protein [Duganella vulcania]MYM86253.1 TolC family protein [Duganella vulcania]